MDEQLRAPGSGEPLSLSFEVIYGHAVKAPPRHSVKDETAIGLDEMRATLRQRNRNQRSL